MSGDTTNAIVGAGDFGKPADTLVKKVSDAVGGLCKPWQIKRVARAEVEADLIRAKGQIEITDLHRRAIHRFIGEEAKKQDNIEQIMAQALPLLEQDSNPDAIEDDWIVNFFDKCRIISDREMQSLWSKVLSGEANAPGTYSRRTVNSLSNFDKSDAVLFTQLCGYIWRFDDLIPLIYDFRNEIYNKNNINFITLSHLESVGLIQFNTVTRLNSELLPKRITTSYFGELIELELPEDSDNSMSVGRVLLTKIGQELVQICGSTQVSGFKEYIIRHWKSKGYIKEDDVEQDASPNTDKPNQ